MQDQRRAWERRNRRQPGAEFVELGRDTIGELVLGPGPHVLGWIELGHVCLEAVNVKSEMVGQERTDLATSGRPSWS